MFETIALSNGDEVLVDKRDIYLRNLGPWHKASNGYAVSSGGKMLMHRIIVEAPKGKVVDHINGNKLDNRRKNLRVASYSTNGHNRHSSTRPAGLRQISSGRWAVYLWVKNKNKYIGSRDTVDEAIQLRAEAELLHLGELSPATRRATKRG